MNSVILSAITVILMTTGKANGVIIPDAAVWLAAMIFGICVVDNLSQRIALWKTKTAIRRLSFTLQGKGNDDDQA